MDAVYPFPGVGTKKPSWPQPANMYSVVLPNPRQVILAGSWTSELLPWLKIIESFQFSVHITEATLAMHINFLDSLVD